MTRTVLSISSQVAFGPVGNSASAPAMEALGVTVYALPTIVLSHHPGHGKPAGVRIPAFDLTAMIDSLELLGVLRGLSGVFTGYFAANDQIFGVARAIRRLKEGNPSLIYLCDPVIGSEVSGLYVPLPVAEAVKSSLLPIADIATPNRFELEWLSDMKIENTGQVDEARITLGLKSLLAKSLEASNGRLNTVLCGELGERSFESLCRKDVPRGTGDLLAGLFLGHLLAGKPGPLALKESLAELEKIIESSTGLPALDLTLLRRMGSQ
jgi:pyridoxine kinase